MTPEEKLACRLIERNHLSVPIDVENLLRRYADLEYDRFPTDPDGVQIADGLCIKTKGTRPKVIINIGQSNTRLRFTLAHELGHVIIPWHVGIMIDPANFLSNRDSVDHDPDSSLAVEAEANRFAAELLMPRAFTLEICRQNPPCDAVARLAETANTSLPAALIRATPFFEPGTIIALTDKFGFISWSGRSPETFVPPPLRGTAISAITQYNFAIDHDTRSLLDGRTVAYWRFEQSKKIPDTSSEIDARLMTSSIAHDISDKNNTPQKIIQSINGVVGAANSRALGQSNEYFHGLLRIRFQNRAINDAVYRRLVAHPDFDRFVVSRVKSLRKI